MCGIFGYVGPQEAVKLALDGIKFLEYRGYDSAGIAGMKRDEAKLFAYKEVGKIANLEAMVQRRQLTLNTAIAHTRWATHGRPSLANAHPHFDRESELAVVHNGIIENYRELKEALDSNPFLSETDTEVIPHLIAHYYDGDLLAAVQKTVARLQGSFALAVVHRDHPEEIVLAARESPLAIGFGEGETFVASDAHAFLAHTQKVLFLQNDQTARVTPKQTTLYDAKGTLLPFKTTQMELDVSVVSKGEFQHFMLKEIFEQPHALRSTLLGRIDEQSATATFEELALSPEELAQCEAIQFLGCGTSWHAGLIGSYMLEQYAGIDVHCDIASEFRYRTPHLPRKTLVIALSQSGETADTIAAVREMKRRGIKVLGICNVTGSTLAREADSCLQLRVGPEIGVASTKAFTAQLVLCALLTLHMGRLRGALSFQEGTAWIAALRRLPLQLEQVLQKSHAIQLLARKYSSYNQFIFLGRSYMYPTCLEGALKLKEISYIHASGYPAGEMKHGPIALIHELCPTVALCANQATYDKMISNMMELKARSGRILAIGSDNAPDLAQIADDLITVPTTLDPLAPVLVSAVTQLLAYEIANCRGTDIDQPRNLAKSVTVE